MEFRRVLFRSRVFRKDTGRRRMKPPVTDELLISLRAYAEPASKKAKAKDAVASKKRQSTPPPASDWVLIFDTETTTDAGQALRFGTYQLRKAGDRKSVV